MARWPRGEAEIERLLGLGHLQLITGAAADGEPLLAKAGRTLATAASITSSDPDSALVLAYDAARYAATALLAQQGLRPTTAGGHVAVDSAIRAQFGDGFRGFGYLRRRRTSWSTPALARPLRIPMRQTTRWPSHAASCKPPRGFVRTSASSPERSSRLLHTPAHQG
jgi:hypothetical protein